MHYVILKKKNFVANRVKCLCSHMCLMLFKGAAGWMGDPDIPLKGFPWKGGAERDTSGILMWSEPFEVSLPGGEKVSVVSLD